EPDGSVRCAAFFIKDITEQISAQQELIESETRHRRLFDENPVPMYIYDTATLKILEANASFIASYGYSRDELTSMSLNDIRPHEDVPKVLENVTDLQSKQVYLGLWRHTKKDGTVIDVEITSGDFPFMDKPARLVLCHDVTEKIRIQKALEEREEQYRHLFEHNPMPMFIIEPETLRIINVNMATLNRYGYDKKEILKMTLRDIRPPEDVEGTVQRIKSMTGPVVKYGVSRHLTKDGELMFMDISSHEIQYEGKKARLALCSEITAQVSARKALEESELKFRSIVESSPMGLHMYRLDEDDNLILTDANPAADRILGIEHRPFMGSKIEDVFPGVGDSDLPVRLREVCSSGSPWSNEQFNYKDQQIEGAFEVYAFQTGQRTAAVLFLDVTEKKRAEEAIAESEEKFRLAFITSPDSVNINKFENGEFVDINEGFSQIMGYDREEVIGRTTIELDIWDDIKDRERLIEALKQDGYAYNLEARFRAKNGDIGIGLMSAKIINLKGEMHILSITRDITDLKNTQNALLRSEEQLKASLVEKEMLLREIHHRVKNNLQVISGLLDLQAHHIRDPVDRELYKDSQNRVITMALIHEALYQSTNLSQVDFAEYIRNLCENLMVSYGADRNRIKLEIEAEKTEMVVDTAIPCGLIINELITNALKHAFPGDRRGTISLTFRRMRNRNYLLVVSDDGVGIPRDMDINDTSTLGMQLVSALTGQLGGTLKVRRSAGTGFTIKFREYHEAGSVLY
ncbi:MAG: PAS domain S-box protein, partial [Pseudomonadota bacterium]